LEFEEFSVDDLAELDMPADADTESSEDASIAAESPTPAAAAPAQAASPAAEEEISFDEDLGMEFNLDDLGGADLSDASAEESPAAQEEDGILSLDIAEEITASAAADLNDVVADFDLSEEPAQAEQKSADSLDGLLDDDLGFDIKDLGEPAAEESNSSEAGDDLGFTLEDLEESPAAFDADEAAPADAAPAAESAEDDTLTFDLADSDAADADTGTPAKDAGSKLKLGEEKGAGGDSEMSRFMKELGL
jgi:hypothetical protein